MRRVAEIMHIVESEREEFLKGALNLTEEEQKILWLCGVRSQQYFAMNDLIFMTFRYVGDNFKEDMAKMAAYMETKGHLIRKRRKDVPVEERATTNWWAPVKRLGSLLEEEPDFSENTNEEYMDYMAMLDGCVVEDAATNSDISYDEDDWSEGMHF